MQANLEGERRMLDARNEVEAKYRAQGEFAALNKKPATPATPPAAEKTAAQGEFAALNKKPAPPLAAEKFKTAAQLPGKRIDYETEAKEDTGGGGAAAAAAAATQAALKRTETILARFRQQEKRLWKLSQGALTRTHARAAAQQPAETSLERFRQHERRIWIPHTPQASVIEMQTNTKSSKGQTPTTEQHVPLAVSKRGFASESESEGSVPSSLGSARGAVSHVPAARVSVLQSTSSSRAIRSAGPLVPPAGPIVPPGPLSPPEGPLLPPGPLSPPAGPLVEPAAGPLVTRQHAEMSLRSLLDSYVHSKE